MEKSETISSAGQDASPAGSITSTRRSFGALRHASFRNLWIGLLVSNFGTWAQNVAQGWLLYQLSDSRLMLGLLGLSFALPMITLPLLGGVIADRFDRLNVLRGTQALAMIMGAILSWLTFTGRITVWHIIGFSFLRAIALAIDNPTRQALIPALIPREDMSSAMALNGIIYTGAGLVGSAMAGLILHRYEGRMFEGSAVVFALNTISYAAVLAPLFLIRLPIKTSRAGNERRSTLAELRDGFAYLRSRPVLGLLVSLSAMTNLFGRSFPQLMPVLARDVLHVGAGGLGAMYSLASAGALMGGLGLAAVGGVRRQRTILVYSFLMMIGSIFILALSRWRLVSLVLLVINGIVTAIMTATIATCIQTNVEERMRGRMMSYYTLTIIGLPPMGGAIAGTIAEWLPVEYAIILPAVVLIFLFLGAVIYAPAWHKLQ